MVKKTITDRVKQLRKALAENNIDTMMVLVEENRRYLSGYTGEDTQFDESAGALLISRTKLVLATDSRFVQQAEKEAPLYEIRCYQKGLALEIPKILRKMRTKVLGFESLRLSHHQYNNITRQIRKEKMKIKFVRADDILNDFRIVKTRMEITRIKQSLSIAESIIADFRKLIKPGMTEKQAAWTMEKALRETGADALSFPVIAASGPNSALPHAIPGNRRIKKGDALILDWGVKLNGYCSDITRTIVFGNPDNKFKKVFTTVHEAQQMAIQAIKPGQSSKAIDEIARQHIARKGFRGRFGHGLGHGIGLAVHEPPGISPIKDTKIRAGMVFTVEPGIYIPGWGGVRLENMVVVRKNGAQVLNTTDSGRFRVV